MEAWESQKPKPKNVAILTSLTWRFATQPNNQWARILQGKYYVPRATNPHTLTFTAKQPDSAT